MPILVPAMLLLAACSAAPDATSVPTTSPAVAKPASAPTPSPAEASAPSPPQASPASPSGSERAEAASKPGHVVPVVAPAGGSISGAILDGNRPPPALRICATPVDGGLPTCVDTPQGARSYRIEVAPGRYHLLGWVHAGELTLIAHASQIRCIRAPCPPDGLIEIRIAAGQHRDGVDLNGGYVDVPDGWPKRPD